MRRSAKTSSKRRLAGATLLATLIIASVMVLAQAPAKAAMRTNLDPTFAISSPLYNGIAEGPVGTNVTVQATAGSGWTPGASIVLSVSLESVGCVSNATSASTPTPAPTASPAPQPIPVSIPPVTVAGDSSFSATFPWPTTAGQTSASPTYVVCANETGAGTQVGRTSNVFNVLSNNAPTVEVSPTTAHAGDPVLVTGANWLPVQSITLYLQGTGLSFKQDAGTILQTTTALVPDSQGNFQVTVHLPTNRIGNPQQGNAQNVVAVMGMPTPDQVFPLEAKSQALTINPPVAATATPQPTIVPTVATTRGTSPPSIGLTEQLLLGLLALIAVVLLIAGIVVAVLALRGRATPSAPGGPRRDSGEYGGGYGGYGPAGSMDATIADGYEDDAPWQQPGRPWSGNRQGIPYDQPPRRSMALDEDDDRYRTRMGDPYQPGSAQQQRPVTPPPSRPPTPPASRPAPPPSRPPAQRPPGTDENTQDTGPLWPPPTR